MRLARVCAQGRSNRLAPRVPQRLLLAFPRFVLGCCAEHATGLCLCTGVKQLTGTQRGPTAPRAACSASRVLSSRPAWASHTLGIMLRQHNVMALGSEAQLGLGVWHYCCGLGGTDRFAVANRREANRQYGGLAQSCNLFGEHARTPDQFWPSRRCSTGHCTRHVASTIATSIGHAHGRRRVSESAIGYHVVQCVYADTHDDIGVAVMSSWRAPVCARYC